MLYLTPAEHLIFFVAIRAQGGLAAPGGAGPEPRG